jgi:hypothetical protein
VLSTRMSARQPTTPHHTSCRRDGVTCVSGALTHLTAACGVAQWTSTASPSSRDSWVGRGQNLPRSSPTLCTLPTEAAASPVVDDTRPATSGDTFLAHHPSRYDTIRRICRVVCITGGGIHTICPLRYAIPYTILYHIYPLTAGGGMQCRTYTVCTLTGRGVYTHTTLYIYPHSPPCKLLRRTYTERILMLTGSGPNVSRFGPRHS